MHICGLTSCGGIKVFPLLFAVGIPGTPRKVRIRIFRLAGNGDLESIRRNFAKGFIYQYQFYVVPGRGGTEILNFYVFPLLNGIKSVDVKAPNAGKHHKRNSSDGREVFRILPGSPGGGGAIGFSLCPRRVSGFFRAVRNCAEGTWGISRRALVTASRCGRTGVNFFPLGICVEISSVFLKFLIRV